MEDPIPLVERLTSAIKDDDLAHFKLLASTSTAWHRQLNQRGYTILQESIRLNRKAIFDYILTLQGPDDLEATNMYGRAALMFSLTSFNPDYYACALIDRGASVHCEYKGANMLHHCIDFQLSLKVIEALLEKGVDVNQGHDSSTGSSVLQNVISAPGDNYECIALLLMYGADTGFSRGTGFNAFELALELNCSDEVVELLFRYTYDNQCEVSCDLLMKLFLRYRAFFDEVLLYDVEIVMGAAVEDYDYEFYDFFHNLLSMDCDSLGLILQKSDGSICECIEKLGNSRFLSDYSYPLFRSDRILENLNLLMESSERMKWAVIDLIHNETYDGRGLFNCLIESGFSKNTITGIFMFFAMYGLKFDVAIYHVTYTHFGYCDLFKFLLNVDVDVDATPTPSDCWNVMAMLIYDLKFTLDDFFKHTSHYLTMNGVLEMLDYFADARFPDLLLNNDDLSLTDHEKVRIENHPRVPLLVELARSAVRGYLTERFQLKSVKGLHDVLDRLPISIVHKKIITMQTKIYFYNV